MFDLERVEGLEVRKGLFGAGSEEQQSGH